MNFSFFRSSIGKKIVMALTGLVLLGFVIGHLAGNLLIFKGPEALNTYAQKLRDLGPLLWAARAGLLLAVGLHIWSAAALAIENRRARPQDYAEKKSLRSSLGAKTMTVSGIFLLAFIVFHLLHFTFGTISPDISHITDTLGRHDVYSMVVLGLQDKLTACGYLLAMILLGLHLSHGFSSALQTLGANNDKTLPLFGKLGKLLALAITIGYLSIPLAIVLGVIGLVRAS